jgi:hypothetical protein
MFVSAGPASVALWSAFESLKTVGEDGADGADAKTSPLSGSGEPSVMGGSGVRQIILIPGNHPR